MSPLRGEKESFIVVVESESAVAEWKKDSSIPLTQVVDAFQVYIGQGAQGILDRPSKQQLENEVRRPNTLGFSDWKMSLGKIIGLT